MLAEHLTSEYFVKTEARGRSVDEWKQRPEQPDNHWFDCLIGSVLQSQRPYKAVFCRNRSYNYDQTRKA